MKAKINVKKLSAEQLVKLIRKLSKSGGFSSVGILMEELESRKTAPKVQESKKSSKFGGVITNGHF